MCSNIIGKQIYRLMNTGAECSVISESITEFLYCKFKNETIANMQFKRISTDINYFVVPNGSFGHYILISQNVFKKSNLVLITDGTVSKVITKTVSNLSIKYCLHKIVTDVNPGSPEPWLQLLKKYFGILLLYLLYTFGFPQVSVGRKFNRKKHPDSHFEYLCLLFDLANFNFFN